MSATSTAAQYLLIPLVIYSALRWIAPSVVSAPAPLSTIPGPAAASWMLGNLGQLFSAKGIPFHELIVDVYGGMVKVYGFFGDQQLYISDPHAIQAILGRDQDCFDETAVFLETNKTIFGPGLVSTTGELHKQQRKITAPMFSNAQLTQVTPTFYEVSKKFVRVLENDLVQQQKDKGCRGPDEGADFRDGKSGVLDMSEWSSRISLEMAGRAILGYSFDPLDSPVSNPYTSAVKELIPTLFSLAILRQFAPFLGRLGPAWFRRKLVEWTPNKAIQRVKNMSDVMYSTAQKILGDRRRQIAEDELEVEDSHGSVRHKDIISLLLKANARATPEERMSDDELTGQMTVLIFGAQDTTASALSRIYHLLSINSQIQGKVRAEIRDAFLDPCKRDALFSESLNAKAIRELPWLDAVIKETLRLYPPVPFVRRVCTKETSIPYVRREDRVEAAPQLTSVTIPKGTILFLSISGFNRMESVWGPDAKEWKPERWIMSEVEGGSSRRTPPYSSTVKVPGAFSGLLSFLGGGRACIGYRFAMIEMKTILTSVLSKLRFEPTEDHIIWNLSQIISPSVSRSASGPGGTVVGEERKGLPLVAILDDLTHSHTN